VESYSQSLLLEEDNPYGIMAIERQGLRIKLIEYSQTLPQGETPVLLTF